MMGTQELNRAYPRMRREWESIGGYVLRLSNPYIKGIPDFLLCHAMCGGGLVEVKCVDDPRDIIGLESHQAKTLDEASMCGMKCRVLVLCLSREEWGVFFAGTLQDHYRVLRYQMAPRFRKKLSPGFLLGDGSDEEIGRDVKKIKKAESVRVHVEEVNRKKWVESLEISHDNEEGAKWDQIKGS
jgi:hypothetical protein